LDEYLNARPIADPLKLFDCVMPCAALKLLVTTEERARQLGLSFARVPAPSSGTMRFRRSDQLRAAGQWL
jgi:hypothetical protein